MFTCFLRMAVTSGLLLMVSLGAQSADAGVLVLKNGDRITGAVKRIWDGDVTIEPEYADEFAVDLDAVAYIESDIEFDIEIEEGRKQTGRLIGPGDNEMQVIEVDGALISLPLSELADLEKPDDYFDWESNIDASTSINKGNTNSEVGKLFANGYVKIGDHRHTVEVQFNRETQNSVPTKSQDLYKYNYNWLFSDPWFTGFVASYERDPIRDLSGRVIAAAVIGRDIWNSPRRFLNFQSGLGYQSESIDEVTNDSAVAIWALRFRYDLLGGDLGFFHNHSITYNLSGRDNTVLKTSTGASYDITDFVYAKLSLDYDYESNPSELATNSDLALLFGLGFEFE
jgi:putative salt-induced outer membrane protein YdiY